ncbi:MAG: HU family DNA-binding protein [Porphyromonas sp.]|nr:HU family DNA-binding protein [Porphyromonas sp.]
MLIFNVASRKASIGKKKGQTLYFAKAVAGGRLTAAAVEDYIADKTTLTRGDVRHAITSLAEVVRWALSEGLAVDLADLGSFKVEASSKMVDRMEDVNAAIIKLPKVRFFPRRAMVQYAQRVAISVRVGQEAIPSAPSSPDKPSGDAGSPGSGEHL